MLTFIQKLRQHAEDKDKLSPETVQQVDVVLSWMIKKQSLYLNNWHSRLYFKQILLYI